MLATIIIKLSYPTTPGENSFQSMQRKKEEKLQKGIFQLQHELLLLESITCNYITTYLQHTKI